MGGKIGDMLGTKPGFVSRGGVAHKRVWNGDKVVTCRGASIGMRAMS